MSSWENQPIFVLKREQFEEEDIDDMEDIDEEDLVCDSQDPSAFKRASKQYAKSLFPTTYSKEPKEQLIARKIAFERVSEQFSKMTKRVMRHLNRDCFDKVAAFINNVGGTNAQSGVPTAVLQAGVNIQDHERTFGDLVEYLRDNNCTSIALLKGSLCPTVEAAIANLNEQAMYFDTPQQGTPSKRSRKQDGDNNNTFVSPTVTPKKRAATLGNLKVLVNWHQQRTTKSPIVVILSDVENFDPEILSAMLESISSERHQLPICLLLGVASTPDVVNAALPFGSSGALSLSKCFQLPTAAQLVEALLLDIVVGGDHRFILGPSVITFILERFFLHDSTISGFLNALKASLLEHCVSAPLSFLVDCDAGEENDALLRDLVTTSAIGRLRSVEDLSLTKEQVRANISGWTTDLSLVRLKLHCALTLTRVAISRKKLEELDQNVQGKNGRDSIRLLLPRILKGYDGSAHGEIHSYEKSASNKQSAFTMVGKSLTAATTDEIILIVEEWKVALGGLLRRSLERWGKTAVGRTCEQQVKEMRNSCDLLLEQLKNGSLNLEKQVLTPSKTTTRLQRVSPTKRGDVLRASSNVQVREDQKAAVKLYEDMIKFVAVNVANLPMNEAVFFNRDSVLRSTLGACIRSDVLAALEYPSAMLGKEATGQTSTPTKADKYGDRINKMLPDICIIHCLSKEHGRVINVPDLYRAFVTIQGKCNASMQARFLQGMSELQSMGIFRRSGRFTDCVEKLIFPAGIDDTN